MIKNEVYKAIDKSQLSLSEKRVLRGLVSFHLKGLDIYASNSYYSDNWGVSTKSVQRAMNFLETKLKVIQVTRKQGATNKVSFIVKMEELIEILAKYIKVKSIIKNDRGQNTANTFTNNVQGHGEIDLRDELKDITKGQNDSSSEDIVPPYIEDNIITNRENNIKPYSEEEIDLFIDSLDDYVDDSLDSSFVEEVEFEELIPTINVDSHCDSEIKPSTIKINSTSIDGLIDFSTTSSTVVDYTNRSLQQEGISTRETMTNTLYEYLNEKGSLSDFLSEENRIQYSYWKGKFFLTTKEGLTLEEVLPSPPLGFDSRLFQQVRVDGGEINKISGEEIKLGSISMILEYVSKGTIDLSKYKPYDLDNIRALDKLQVR